MSIDLRLDDRVAVVTVNRPEVLNALSSELLDELLNTLRRPRPHDPVRA